MKPEGKEYMCVCGGNVLYFQRYFRGASIGPSHSIHFQCEDAVGQICLLPSDGDEYFAPARPLHCQPCHALRLLTDACHLTSLTFYF